MPQVYQIIHELKDKPLEKAAALKVLENEGNFMHNIQVLDRKKDGYLVVARRTGEHHEPHEYLPCEFCKEFLLKRMLYRHIKNCKVKALTVTTDPQENDPDTVNVT